VPVSRFSQISSSLSCWTSAPPFGHHAAFDIALAATAFACRESSNVSELSDLLPLNGDLALNPLRYPLNLPPSLFAGPESLSYCPWNPNLSTETPVTIFFPPQEIQPQPLNLPSGFDRTMKSYEVGPPSPEQVATSSFLPRKDPEEEDFLSTQTLWRLASDGIAFSAGSLS